MTAGVEYHRAHTNLVRSYLLEDWQLCIFDDELTQAYNLVKAGRDSLKNVHGSLELDQKPLQTRQQAHQIGDASTRRL